MNVTIKRLLYLTNIEVPYRVRFFNELTKHCDLTVLYESRKSGSRNAAWAKSEGVTHRVRYIRGRKNGNEANTVSLFKELSSGYDAIIVGCFNSPIQMLAILYMRLHRIPYIINLDGETFLEGNGIKTKLKRFFLSGAEKYVVAGEKASQSLKAIARERVVIPYYFSSLSGQEIEENRALTIGRRRNDTILVVGQYVEAKGLDVALTAARLNQSLRYKFVGMGNRTELFLKDFRGRIPENVEIIPFLQKTELKEEYQNCAILVLPSRQECWGLVINEAASFGMPIVSTWGSGAAVEFLADEYPEYLAKPGDAESLYQCICRLLSAPDKENYCRFLLDKSKEYTIDRSVREHMFLL